MRRSPVRVADDPADALRPESPLAPRAGIEGGQRFDDMTHFESDEREWLEPDGRGGFASGTVSGVRTRRYHALLLTATTPPTGRMVLVNGFDAWIEIDGRRMALSSQRYAPDVVSPDGRVRIEGFAYEPWPTWTFRVDDMVRVRQEIFVPHGESAVIVTWRLVDTEAAPVSAGGNLRLIVRPFLSGRDYHSLHHENTACRQEAVTAEGFVIWRPYADVPAVISRSNGRYDHRPDWYRTFLYQAERERGLDDVEDLFTPGELIFDLSRGEAVWLLEAQTVHSPTVPADAVPVDTVALVERARADARMRRAAFASPLARAADTYLVRRGAGLTIVAGYPWFTDWGRDTFIALRGLTLTTGRVDAARDILLEWSGAVSEGMLPNRFPDAGDAPEFNSVDASLWFIVAVESVFGAVAREGRTFATSDRDRLLAAVHAIVEGYSRGTRFGIRMDADGLLACGVPGSQLTWMDARVGDWTVTPRVGKPVEVQALWLNALRVAGVDSPVWRRIHVDARQQFVARFWNADAGCLYDVIDVDHVPGRIDATCRPNQIFAVGGLPESLLDEDRARRVVDTVERRLWTPLGLRSLAPGEPGYAAHYEGAPVARDSAYHQGTVWPWLVGAFVEAWLRTRGGGKANHEEARARFFAPLEAHLGAAGLGHVSEIADAECPFAPRGCPFQAWSVGEVLRLEAMLDSAANVARRPSPAESRDPSAARQTAARR
jgi:predicted glycogen debranching enzyme